MRKEKIARLAAIVACTVLVAGLSVQQAVANLAGCSNCIEASDIDVGAVRASELNNDLDDSINANDIASSGVGKAELASNSVGLSELSAAAQAVGGEVQMLADVVSTTSASDVQLDTLTITAPAAGKVLVHLDGQFWVDHVSGGAGDIATVEMGLCTATATITPSDCGRTYSQFFHADADTAANSTDASSTVALARVLPVAAGANVFYFNANTNEGTLNVYDLFASVAFVPAGTLTLA